LVRNGGPTGTPIFGDIWDQHGKNSINVISIS
jgi:hypothetical protein